MNGSIAEASNPRRILLLALLPIGDTLLMTPTIRALRDRYPEASITALVHASNEPILRCVPSVDRSVVLPMAADWRGAGTLLRTLWRMRAQRYDVAIDFTSPAYKWISIFCGIRLRTYMKFDHWWWLIPADHAEWRSTHASQHYYDCARELDVPPWHDVDHRLELIVPATERIATAEYLRSHGLLDDGRPIVTIHAGGSWLGGRKRWPAPRFAALADSISTRWNAHIVLVGGPEERDVTEEIGASMQTRPLNAAGSLPLLHSIAVVQASNLFVGNDSGLLHAAAALGTPFVGIFGPTSLANFHPVARHQDQGDIVVPAVQSRHPQYFVGSQTIWSKLRRPEKDAVIATIDLETVVARVDALLRRHAERRPALLADGEAATGASATNPTDPEPPPATSAR